MTLYSSSFLYTIVAVANLESALRYLSCCAMRMTNDCTCLSFDFFISTAAV